MSKLMFVPIIVAGLVTPISAFAQMSNSTTAAPPGKTATFNGGIMTNGSVAPAGGGSKIIGNGTNSGQVGTDTPAASATGTMDKKPNQQDGAAKTNPSP